MLKSNIIQRRDLEPLWLRANELVRHYEKAAGCITAVMGADCVEVELSKHPKALFFCSLCKRYNQSAAKMAPYEYPCSPMHLDAADKARRLGGSYIYSCPLGFLYWTSPFFAGERFAGAFISSVMPASEKQKIIDRIFALCKREISKPAISQYLSDVPQKSGGEIEALARLLLLCAEHISSSGPCRDD
ncbi:MAG: PocR ligand-binding domain-containing protein, partial [Treponema sp.]|nr:PocR ligand-binding domain-containing protein [Treponema sp.]